MFGILPLYLPPAVEFSRLPALREVSEGTGVLGTGIVWSAGGHTGAEEENREGVTQASWSRGTLHQLDAAASTRHEQEKSIRPTRLLSVALPPWERRRRIKASREGGKRTGAEVFVAWFVSPAAFDRKITFTHPDTLDTSPSLFCFAAIRSRHAAGQ